MDIPALALRAADRPARAERQFPSMLTIGAFELARLRHLYYTSVYSKHLSLDQRLGNFLPGGLHNAAKGLAGDSHLLRSRLLVQAL